MRVSEFEVLCEQKKADLLYKKGVYVGKVRKEGRIHVLYQLDSFYVEVSYKKYRTAIENLRCFDSMSELDPYLEGIHLEPFVYL